MQTDELRPVMRAENPRARAAARAAEIRGHLGGMDAGTDEFFIDPAIIPDGWSYEWKTETVYGAENPAYQVSLSMHGWDGVPTSRHPSMMPGDGAHTIIRRKGMILMERPEEITQEARAIELQRARGQVRVKEQQLSNAAPGTFDRNLAKVKKGYEPMPIPE